jgi:hypothetical protein
MNVLSSDNSNLRQSQKEFLLWHQRLSHYNMPAILSLMKDRVRLQDADNPDNALHKNTILLTKN